VCLALVATACGVPAQGSPASISDDDLPASLRAVETSTSEPGTVADTDVTIYLIDDGRLVRVNDRADGSELGDALALLQRGPTAAQARAGLRSAFTDFDLITNAQVAGTTSTIDLDPSFSDLPHQDQILALGQIVLTAVSQPGISRARFTVDGKLAEVPTGGGKLTAAPLTRADYSALLRV
jgi:spore germination protein GerM